MGAQIIAAIRSALGRSISIPPAYIIVFTLCIINLL